MAGEKPEPYIDENGLPTCTADECGAYDGKRCSLMGFRPAVHCEPKLIEDYAELAQLRARGEGK